MYKLETQIRVRDRTGAGAAALAPPGPHAPCQSLVHAHSERMIQAIPADSTPVVAAKYTDTTRGVGRSDAGMTASGLGCEGLGGCGDVAAYWAPRRTAEAMPAEADSVCMREACITDDVRVWPMDCERRGARLGRAAFALGRFARSSLDPPPLARAHSSARTCLQIGHARVCAHCPCCGHDLGLGCRLFALLGLCFALNLITPLHRRTREP